MSADWPGWPGLSGCVLVLHAATAFASHCMGDGYIDSACDGDAGGITPSGESASGFVTVKVPAAEGWKDTDTQFDVLDTACREKPSPDGSTVVECSNPRSAIAYANIVPLDARVEVFIGAGTWRLQRPLPTVQRSMAILGATEPSAVDPLGPGTSPEVFQPPVGNDPSDTLRAHHYPDGHRDQRRRNRKHRHRRDRKKGTGSGGFGSAGDHGGGFNAYRSSIGQGVLYPLATIFDCGQQCRILDIDARQTDDTAPPSGGFNGVNTGAQAVIVENILFQGGVAFLDEAEGSDNSLGYTGGAVRNRGRGSHLRMINCALIANRAHFGGAVYTEGDFEFERGLMQFNTANCGGGLYAVEGGTPVQIKAAVFEQNHDNGCGFMTHMTGLNGRTLPAMLAPPTTAVDARAAIGSGGEGAMMGHEDGNGQGEFVNTGGAIHTGPPVDDFGEDQGSDSARQRWKPRRKIGIGDDSSSSDRLQLGPPPPLPNH